MEKKFLKQTAAAVLLTSSLLSFSPAAYGKTTSIQQSMEAIKVELNKSTTYYVYPSLEGELVSSSALYPILNSAKKNYETAKKALAASKLSEKEKQAQLKEIEALYQEKITKGLVPYIDAYNYADKYLNPLLKDIKEAEAKNDFAAVEKAYHKLSYQLKGRTAILYRFSGKASRDLLLEKYKKPADDKRDELMVPVTIYMKTVEIDKLLLAGKKEEAKKVLESIQALLHRLPSAEKNPFIAELLKEVNKVQEEINPTAVVPPVTGGGTSGGGGGSSYTPPNVGLEIQSELTQPGTYGPTSGSQVIEGNLIVNSPDVTLRNVTIKGDLILGEQIGEGDVHLQGVNVQGKTIVNGGGKNSIYFTDSVLATVIVNKNTGAVRIVAQGNTQVVEVQLETPTLVVESGLSGNATGFENVVVSEAMQAVGSDYQVELVGEFETINSRASNIRISLSETTDIRTLILNAATQIFGTGNIRTAEINANGSTLSQRPQNVVLNIGQVEIAGDQVTESYSDESVTETTISAIKASQGSVSLDLTNFISSLTAEDFQVSAKIDGQPYTLQNVNYNANLQRLTYSPIPLSGNIGKTAEITVQPSQGNTVVRGEVKTASFEVGTGFAGRITDIQGVGTANLNIKFRQGTGTQEGTIVGETTTDRHGYYSINLPAGTYTGEFSGPGYVTSYMVGNAASDVFLIDQNETAIRSAASNEVKIMLSWGEHPRDLDSHLTGPGADGLPFHIAFYNKKEIVDGTTYVDLDWDDTDSFGPETTTIRKLVDGEYRFYIHNWSGESDLGSSGAKVSLYKGNTPIPNSTFEVPEINGDARYWIVFDLKVSNNGETLEVIPINEMVYTENPQYETIESEVSSLERLVNFGEELPSLEDIVLTENMYNRLLNIISPLNTSGQSPLITEQQKLELLERLADVKVAIDSALERLNAMSADSSVSSITVAGVAGILDETTGKYNVVLPSETDLTKIEASDIIAEITDEKATMTSAITSDSGKTWTVIVKAENGSETVYTINVTVEEIAGSDAKVESIEALSEESGIYKTSLKWSSFNGIGTNHVEDFGRYSYFDDGSYLEVSLEQDGNPIHFAEQFTALTLQTDGGTVDTIQGNATGRQAADWGTLNANHGGTTLDINNGKSVFYGVRQNSALGTRTVGFEAGDNRQIDLVLTPKTEIAPGTYTITVRAMRQTSASTGTQLGETITYTINIPEQEETNVEIQNEDLVLDGQALLVKFSVGEDIDLSNAANVKLSYYIKDESGNLIPMTNSIQGGAPLIKDKSWAGYLANVNPPAANYSMGTDGNVNYSNTILADTLIGSKVQKGYHAPETDMDYVEITDFSTAPGAYVVIIEVTNNAGKVATKQVELIIE